MMGRGANPRLTNGERTMTTFETATLTIQVAQLGLIGGGLWLMRRAANTRDKALDETIAEGRAAREEGRAAREEARAAREEVVSPWRRSSSARRVKACGRTKPKEA